MLQYKVLICAWLRVNKRNYSCVPGAVMVPGYKPIWEPSVVLSTKRGVVVPTTPDPTSVLLKGCASPAEWGTELHSALQGWQAAATQLQAFLTGRKQNFTPGGSLQAQRLEASSFACCFAIFHNHEAKSKAFPIDARTITPLPCSSPKLLEATCER